MSKKLSGKSSSMSKKESTQVLNKMRALSLNIHKTQPLNKKVSSNNKKKSTNVAKCDSEEKMGEDKHDIHQTATDLLHNKEFIVEYAAHQQRVKKKMDNLLTPFARKENEVIKSTSLNEGKLVENYRNRLDSRNSLDASHIGNP